MIIGSFEAKSQTFVASDPCYMPGTWCQVLIEPVQKGLWRTDAETGPDGEIKILRAFHEDHQPVNYGLEEILIGDVGIESEAVGIFEAAFYRSNDMAEPVQNPRFGEEGSEWVDMCIDKSKKESGCGSIPHGAVCRAKNTARNMRDGEGGSVRVSRAKTGLIIAVELVLIP